MQKMTDSDSPRRDPPSDSSDRTSSPSGGDYALRLLQMAALWLYAAVVLLSSCTHPRGEERDADTLALISELTRQAEALQCSDTDSAIRLERRALDALQGVHNDSLHTDLLIRLGYAYAIKNDWERSDSCYAAAEEAAASYPRLQVDLLINQSINQEKRGHSETALSLYDRAYELAIQSVRPNETALRRIDNNRAVSYQKRAQYDSAMTCLQRAMRIAEKQGESGAIADALTSMGHIREHMRDDEQADSLFQLADSLYTLINDVRKRIDSKINRVITLNRLGLHDEALAISFEAERMADSIGNKAALGTLYNNRGNIYFYRKDYPQSLEMARRSLELNEQMRDTAGIIAALNTSAAIHIEMKAYDEAIRKSLKALQLSEEKGVVTYLQDIYEHIAAACIRSGDFRAATEYLEKLNALKDSVFTREKYAVIQETNTRYETEKREQTLQTAMLRLNKNRQGVFALTLLSALLAVACAYVYITQRRKLQQYVLIAQQSEKVAELTERTLSPQCGSDETERSAAGLSEEKSKELLLILRNCMEERKLYKDPSLTLETLSEAIGTNRSYLSILINSRMKKGFTEYVNFYRVREGKRLLKETDYKIAAISQEVGYGSPQSFYTAFRNATQLTPTQYRKAVRAANGPEEMAESEK